MADNTLHPVTGTGTADVTQRTIDVGGGVQAAAVIPVDTAGVPIPIGLGTPATATWTSGTSINAAVEVDTDGWLGAVFSLRVTSGTASNGTIRIEGTLDGTNWIQIAAIDISGKNTDYAIDHAVVSDLPLENYSGATFSDAIFVVPGYGCTKIRLLLFETITGTYTVDLALYPSNNMPDGLSAASLDLAFAIRTAGEVEQKTRFMAIGGVASGTNREWKVNSDGSGDVTVVAAPTGTSSTRVQGPAADGAAPVGNPVLIAGQDGTNLQSVLTDTTGRPIVVGAAADGAAEAGNPVLVGGSDGTNAQSLKVDTGGRVLVVGGIAEGSGIQGNPVPIAGSDGGIVRRIATNNSGQTIVVGTGTLVAQIDGAALTALQLIDDPVATLGTDTYTETTTKGVVVGVVRRDADTTLVGTTNEIGPLQMDANGRLKVEAFSGETLPVSLATLPALVAGAANIGDVDVLTVPTDPFGANADAASVSGSISAKLRQIATNGTKLTDGSLTAGLVDETGASAVDALAVGGGTAHDAVNSGNPILLGAEAIAHGANPTAVAAADRTKLYANRAGVSFVIGGHPNIVTVKHTTITTAVTDAAIVTVAGGLKIVVTRITVTLDNASTVFPTLLIGFGTTNTPTTTGVLVAHGGVPAGGGMNVGDGSGMLGVGADGEDLRVTTTGNATGNGLQICVSYYTIES